MPGGGHRAMEPRLGQETRHGRGYTYARLQWRRNSHRSRETGGETVSVETPRHPSRPADSTPGVAVVRSASARYVSLLLPMRTVLLVAAAAGGHRCLPRDRRHVPDRLHRCSFSRSCLSIRCGSVIAKTRHVSRSGLDRDGARHGGCRGRGRAVVPCAARGVRCGTSSRSFRRRSNSCGKSDELSGWFGNSGAAENVQAGADKVSSLVPDAISAVLGVAGGFFSVFLASFTIIFICSFSLMDVANLKPGPVERPDARGGRALAWRFGSA